MRTWTETDYQHQWEPEQQQLTITFEELPWQGCWWRQYLVLEWLDCIGDLIQRCPMDQLHSLSSMGDPEGKLFTAVNNDINLSCEKCTFLISEHLFKAIFDNNALSKYVNMYGSQILCYFSLYKITYNLSFLFLFFIVYFKNFLDLISSDLIGFGSGSDSRWKQESGSEWKRFGSAKLVMVTRDSHCWHGLLDQIWVIPYL